MSGGVSALARSVCRSIITHARLQIPWPVVHLIPTGTVISVLAVTTTIQLLVTVLVQSTGKQRELVKTFPRWSERKVQNFSKKFKMTIATSKARKT